METIRELPKLVYSIIITKEKDEYFPVAGSLNNKACKMRKKKKPSQGMISGDQGIISEISDVSAVFLESPLERKGSHLCSSNTPVRRLQLTT